MGLEVFVPAHTYRQVRKCRLIRRIRVYGTAMSFVLSGMQMGKRAAFQRRCCAVWNHVTDFPVHEYALAVCGTSRIQYKHTVCAVSGPNVSSAGQRTGGV